jgi:hypothetical protein
MIAVDAYVEKMIDRDAFETRRSALIFEEARLKEQTAALADGLHTSADHALELFELAKSLYSGYISANPDEKRNLVDRTTSNRVVAEKNLAFELKSPFREVANRSKCRDGGPKRDDIRTLAQLFITATIPLDFFATAPSNTPPYAPPLG